VAVQALRSLPFEAGDYERALHTGKDNCRDGCHKQVADPDNQKHLGKSKGIRCQDFSLAGKLDAGHHVGQRGIFDRKRSQGTHFQP